MSRMLRILSWIPTRKFRLDPQVRHDVFLGLLGFLFGASVIGFRNLSPTSLEWLQGDAIGAQITQEFYWRSPWWQFPFNATPNYGVGWQTGLNQMAQNSIVTLAFKPIAVLFESGFQIQGIWLSSCFGAHAIIARRIFATLKTGRAAEYLGVVMLVLSPVLFSRIGTLWHPQLAAHWLILLAILMYLRKTSVWSWLLLISFSLSVMIYLCVIVTCVALAALFNQRVLTHDIGNKVQRIRSFTAAVAAVMTALVGSMILLGFGGYLGNSTVITTGRYRLNLLAFFNPGDEGYDYLLRLASFFRFRVWPSEEGEGFAYLGLGVLLSLAILAFVVATRILPIRRDLIPLIFVAVLLFMTALSEGIAVGGREFALPVPTPVIEIRQIFRAVPRFGWLAYYLLMIAGWHATSIFSRRVQLRGFHLTVLSTLALLQVTDVGPGVFSLHREISNVRAEFAPTLAAEWAPLLSKYDRVAIVPSVDASEDDVDLTKDERAWFADNSLTQLAWLSSLNNVELNYTFCSRSCIQSARRATKLVREELSRPGIESGTIYVFADEHEWRLISREKGLKPQILSGLMVVVGPSSD